MDCNSGNETAASTMIPKELREDREFMRKAHERCEKINSLQDYNALCSWVLDSLNKKKKEA